MLGLDQLRALIILKRIGQPVKKDYQEGRQMDQSCPLRYQLGQALAMAHRLMARGIFINNGVKERESGRH